MKLERADKRVLFDDTLFFTSDAARKTPQFKKDLFNDQDSVAAPSRIETMIKNVLMTKKGTFHANKDFGIDVDSLMFEQLNWATIEFLRTYITNGLETSLPINITHCHIEVDPKLPNTLEISLQYSVMDGYKWLEPGPQTIGDRVLQFTASYKGFKG